jgi:hypothetical protein
VPWNCGKPAIVCGKSQLQALTFSLDMWIKISVHKGCGEQTFLSTGFPQFCGSRMPDGSSDPGFIHNFRKPYYSSYKKFLI